MIFSELIGRHANETAWIVGKGPSLKFLRAPHFFAGPVIAINESILNVQDLGLSNKLYGINKDGCRGGAGAHKCTMTHPNADVTMILQRPGFSEFCFPDQPDRLWVNAVDDLGFDHAAVMSIRMCIAIAKSMGCIQIMVACCDSLVNKDVRIYDGGLTKASGASGHYLAVAALVKMDLKDIAHKYILPRNEER
jgi:hypothetical protein